MQSHFVRAWFAKFAALWLLVIVHLDAFCAAPRVYLTASKWWLLRKRVRARSQWAPLLGQSPRAYALWEMRQVRPLHDDGERAVAPPIIALIAMASGDGAGALAATLTSLAEQDIPALLIGSCDTPDLASAAAGIDWSAQPWIMPMAPGDRLAPGAASAYRKAMGDAQTNVIFADDDHLDSRGLCSAPHFKPDWNSELFQHFDYLSNSCVLRASPQTFAALAKAEDWPQRLVTEAVKDPAPRHLQQMLHHRRTRPTPRVPASPLVLARDLPKVSVIIPTRNRHDLLRTCVAGLAASDYPDIEIIIVDNDSDDPQTLAYLAALDPVQFRVLHHPGPFNFSAINNHAVAQARGQLLCLLNNDIEVIQPDWLAVMASQALRAEVGAVGARLLYPDGRIQHAGVVLGLGNAAGHAHRFVRPQDPGYFSRHNLPQFTSSVTGACLVVARERFIAVGGLDETNFAVAFNDVDLCLRLQQRGWQSLYEPRATLIHRESVSRGNDLDHAGAARFAGELAALRRIWKTDTITDPYHHPQLSRASERFAVAI